jgi:hypothetical protein
MTFETCIAFRGPIKIGEGTAHDIVRAIFREGGDRRQGAVLVFDARTSHPVELDLRGSEAEALARLSQAATRDATPDATRDATPAATSDSTPDASTEAPPRRGPGRPRLGVVPREVTLLPRHWDWLNRQPGGASAAIRRLVEQARTSSTAGARESRRAAQESAYRFLSSMLGNEDGFEAATRALFAADAAAFEAASAAWPADLRDHARRLAATAFAP